MLATRGAGYIGSHARVELLEAGYTPVVYDLVPGNIIRQILSGNPVDKGERVYVATDEVGHDAVELGVL